MKSHLQRRRSQPSTRQATVVAPEAHPLALLDLATFSGLPSWSTSPLTPRSLRRHGLATTRSEGSHGDAMCKQCHYCLESRVSRPNQEITIRIQAEDYHLSLRSHRSQSHCRDNARPCPVTIPMYIMPNPGELCPISISTLARDLADCACRSRAAPFNTLTIQRSRLSSL